MSSPVHATVDSIALLRRALATAIPPTDDCARPDRPTALYSIWRLLTSWKVRQCFGSDEAVLLRQSLRWLERPLLVERVAPSIESFFGLVGITHGPDGFLVAEPYSPQWLLQSRLPSEGLDHVPGLRRTDEHVPCEGYRPGRCDEWHSQAQKEAVWAATTASPGSTLLIALPTGAGKSTCFHLIPWTTAGLTLVVVPTVALGIDQFRRAESVLRNDPTIRPRYCASADPNGDPLSVADDVRQRRTRLVFASPEACVSGTLKNALHDAAESGWLNTLVIDEAHLIETWGIYFRVDFQLLAGERRRWWTLTNGQLRTMLLSATFTPSSREVLQNFFGGPGAWEEIVSQRLRPEIEYYSRIFNTSAEQDSAVLDALWHLPRPCIFYTTEPDRAEGLAESFAQQGFNRIACFHGNTSGVERREIVRRWTDDEVDIIAATSAFGVGVDKGNIRSVVHACLPENLNRYYQEVGRGGRDGYSSISILMPCKKDFDVAKSLTPTLMKPESLKERWDAMLATGENLGNGEWKLRPAAKRMSLVGTTTGKQNVLWNKRLLLQLQRAHLLNIEEIGFTYDEECPTESDWVRVRPRFAAHSPDIPALIEPFRKRELEQLFDGIDQMCSVFDDQYCLSRHLRAMYGPETVRVCGSCPYCRAADRRYTPCAVLPIPPSVATQPDLTVVENWPDLFRGNERSAARELFRSLYIRHNVRRFVCDAGFHSEVIGFISEALIGGVVRAFRVDALGEEAVNFIVRPNEVVVVLHFGSIIPEAEGLRVGTSIIHGLCSTSGRDGNGRHFLESDGARLLHDPHYLFEA